MNYDHLTKAHRLRAVAEEIERRDGIPSGDADLDAIIADLRERAVGHLRKLADMLESK